MTVDDAAAWACQRMNLNAQVEVTRFADLGMDLDKPHQYDIIKAELESIKFNS
jgi:hypothetical protein